MIRKLSPGFVRGAVNLAVYGVARGFVNGAVHRAVHNAVDGYVWLDSGAVSGAVNLAVQDTVHWALYRASQFDPPHPNLQRFVGEIWQAR